MGTRISIDAMGGDHAPLEAVKGCIDFARKFPEDTVLLAGREDEISSILKQENALDLPNLEIHHASQVIGMDDSPVSALKEKKDSSIAKAVSLVKEGNAEGIVSAGNTGAFAAQCTLGLKRIKGIKRPGILAPLPTETGIFYIVDAGANSESKPEYLYEHAILGAVYCQHLFHKEKPVVALLNIGTEEGKGNKIVNEAHRKISGIQDPPFNYSGFVEGRDVYTGNYDLVVTEGFVGNVVLKLSEGIGSALLNIMKKEIKKTPVRMVGAFMLKKVFQTVKEIKDYEEYGGAILIGVDAPVTILHGASGHLAFSNGIENSVKLSREHIIDKVKKELELIQKAE